MAQCICAYLGLYGDVQRGSRWLSADGSWTERTRKMEKGLGVGHGGGLPFGGATVVGEAAGGRRRCESWWGRSTILFAKSGQVRFASTGHRDLFSGGDFHVHWQPLRLLSHTSQTHLDIYGSNSGGEKNMAPMRGRGSFRGSGPSRGRGRGRGGSRGGKRGGFAAARTRDAVDES
jgi:hypothetical protein